VTPFGMMAHLETAAASERTRRFLAGGILQVVGGCDEVDLI